MLLKLQEFMDKLQKQYRIKTYSDENYEFEKGALEVIEKMRDFILEELRKEI